MPQAQAYYADRTPIPADKMADAIAKGEAHFEQGARVSVVVDGKAGSVLADELPQLLQNPTATLADPAAMAAKESAAAKAEALKPYGTVAQKALLYHEQLLEGGSMGIYGQLAEAIAPEYAEGYRKRRQANPVQAAVNEGAATVGGMMLGGELAAPLRALSLTRRAAGVAEGAGVAERLAGIATAPARAVVGAGEAAGGATVRGLARLGVSSPGALMFGRGVAQATAEGAALGVAHELSQSTLEDRELSAEKLWAEATKGALFGAAGGAVVGGVGAAGRAVVRGMAEGQTMSGAIGRWAERRAVKAVTGNYQKVYNDLTHYGKHPEVIERVGRKLLDRGVNLTDEAKAVHGIKEQLDLAESRMGEIAHVTDKSSPYFDMQQMADAARDIAARNAGKSLPEFDAIANHLDETANGLERDIARDKLWTFDEAWKWRTDLGKTVKWSGSKAEPWTDAQRELYHRADDALEGWVAKYEPDKLAGWKAAKEDFHDFIKLKDGAEHLVIAREKNRWLSPSDHGVGGVVTMLGALTGAGGLGAVAAGVASSAANKIMRERGPGVVARLADRLAKADLRMNTALDSLVAGKAMPVQTRTERLAPATGVALILQAGHGREPSDFERKAAHVVAVANDPKLAATRLSKATEQLSLDHPDLIPLTHRLAMATAEYLAQKLPTPLTRAPYSLTPGAEKTRLPRAAAAKWLREYRGAVQPMDVIEDMTRGKFDREGIEAMKATSPLLWQNVRQGVIRRVSESTKPLPFKRRMLLSLAFDFEGDRSLRPGALQSIQDNYEPTEEAKGPPPGADIGPKIAADMATETQKG